MDRSNSIYLSCQYNPLICPQNGDVKKQNRAPVSYGWRELTPNSAMDEITKKMIINRHLAVPKFPKLDSRWLPRKLKLNF